MHSLLREIGYGALIGMGATAIMDVWLSILKRMNVPTLDFALIGRWFGHTLQGRWKHDAIARAAPVRGELALGWIAHYAIGIAFAWMLLGVTEATRTQAPRLLPALGVGIGTVFAPWFVMQPAMGAGIASSRTRTPVRNCLRSLLNHAVFGLGLYVAATLLAWITR